MSEKALVDAPFISPVGAVRSKWGLRIKGLAAEPATVFGLLLLAVALIVGLATAHDFGVTIDEFNTNDYGPKFSCTCACVFCPTSGEMIPGVDLTNCIAL